MQKITTFLWFDTEAEEAAKYYVSIFKNSKILSVTHYGAAGSKASGRPLGLVMTVEFQLEGQKFVALNGGPHFKFTEAISLVVNCETQAEVNTMWKKLSAGGEESQCGWLKDKYGLSWQITPVELMDAIKSKDPEIVERAMAEMMKMTKIELAPIRKAIRQAPGKRKGTAT